MKERIEWMMNIQTINNQMARYILHVKKSILILSEGSPQKLVFLFGFGNGASHQLFTCTMKRWEKVSNYTLQKYSLINGSGGLK